MSWRKRLLWALGALALLGAIAWGFMPRPPRVEVAVVGRGPLRVLVEEEGRTRVQDRYVLSAPVPGYAPRLALEVGDLVQERQVILRLEPLRSQSLDPRSRAEAQARVAAAEAGRQRAEAEARAAASEASLAESELARLTRLHEAGTVPDDALEQAQSRARRSQALRRSAEFAVQIAHHEMEAAQAALAYTANEDPDAAAERIDVVAPVGGRVLRRPHESEGVVQAGEPLLEVGDPSRLEVEVEVLSPDAVRVLPGMRVLLSRWGGEAELEGQVRTVEPVGFTKVSALGVEEQRVLVIVDLLSPPEAWARLGDGYRVEAAIVVWEGEDVLQVPTSALFRGDEGWAVFSVDAAGVARRTAVRLGRQNGLSAEVVEGLSAGERVITHPDDTVSDGLEVRPR